MSLTLLLFFIKTPPASISPKVLVLLLLRRDSTAKLRGIQCLIGGQELAESLLLVPVHRLFTVSPVLLLLVAVILVTVGGNGKRPP